MGKYRDIIREAYEQQQFFGKEAGVGIKPGKSGDIRYNKPKEDPKTSEEKVDETIENTEIYKRAKEQILKAQRKQVAYGLDKYPEPLNADTWTMLESIDHILDETIDKIHYLVMLRIQLEKQAEETTPKSMNGYAKADVEATQRAYEALYSGADFDGDYVHEYTNYLNEEPNFSICQQPDYKRNAQEISITMTIPNDELAKHDDSVDALVYSIKHHLDKMKDRGLL
jgi:hypothetical protein